MTKQPANPFISLVEGDTLILRRRWFNPIYIVVAAMAVFWLGITFLPLVASLLEPGSVEFGSPFVFLLAPLVSVFLAYYAFAGFRNTTIVKADKQWVTVTHKPAPWFGNRQVPAGQISHILVKESFWQNRGSKMYELRTAVHNEKPVCLIRLTDQQQVTQVAEKIATHLNIPVQIEL